MNVQRIVSFVLLCSIMMFGILMGGPFPIFFDATSFALFFGVVGGGIALHAAVSALKSAQKKTQTSVSKEEA